MNGRHLIAIRHLEVPQIEELLALAKDFKSRVQAHKPVDAMSSCVLGMLFFENSTRTRMSFEQAAHYLGLKTASFTGSSSSMTKGETLKDTILTLSFERLDGLVMRHKLSGAATLAARYFDGPVINAGDGQHEHPTQALGDALTIIERKGGLEGLTVAIVGDMEHSRVARSNAWLLSKMGAEVRFVGPRVLIPKETGRLPGKVFYSLADGLYGADVVMCLRLQHERMGDGLMTSVSQYTELYQINRETLRHAKKDCLVMHPGPINRGIEIDDIAADSERSAISNQVENGIFVRMAALHWAFKDHEPALPTKPRSPKK
ncbi:MAG: aspartate carbamoyltransferase catalytic subunit [Fimbriimonadaceae bacterium]